MYSQDYVLSYTGVQDHYTYVTCFTHVYNSTLGKTDCEGTGLNSHEHADDNDDIPQSNENSEVSEALEALPNSVTN